jgi:hypothetical protein
MFNMKVSVACKMFPSNGTTEFIPGLGAALSTETRNQGTSDSNIDSVITFSVPYGRDLFGDAL